MYGLTRGTTTLLGAGIAGALIWFASWVGMDANGEYWAAMGLLAAGGLVMALSQLLGGWTKWGWPTVSPTVFLLAFVPTLIAAGWVVVAGQPNANGPRDATRDWLASIGLFDNLLEVLIGVAPVIAFGLGLVFGFVFDTTGPRRREEVRHEEGYGAEEPLAAEREHVTTPDTIRTRPTERHEPAGVGAGTPTREPGTPTAPQPEPHARPRRRLFGR